MTVMAEFMFIDWLACLAGTYWIVKCMLPYWRRELKLENTRIKACAHLIFVAMLIHLFLHMPLETLADPRLWGQCEWYPISFIIFAIGLAGPLERASQGGFRNRGK